MGKPNAVGSNKKPHKHQDISDSRKINVPKKKGTKNQQRAA